MTYEPIIKNIRNKVYHPIYLLMGAEAWYIDSIAGCLEDSVLSESEKEFNLTVMYGQETNALAIIQNAKRYPMMSNYQVIIVKEAQNLKDFDGLLPYFEKPLKSTILVLCYKYKTADKRKKIFKEAEKQGLVFEAKQVYESKIPEWIVNYLKEYKYSIQPKASLLLAEYLGNDLARIVNELSKLMLNVPASTHITPDHIEKYIGISKDFNTFELQKALAEHNIRKANQIIGWFNANPKNYPLVVTLSILFSFFSKLFTWYHLKDRAVNNVSAALKINPWFIKDYETGAKNYRPAKLKAILSDIREYDARSKGINNGTASDGELLRELVYKILH